MKLLEEGDWRKGNLKSLNIESIPYARRKDTRINRWSDRTLKTAALALASTLFIMFIFSVVGTETNSSLANAGEGLVLLVWFLPDIISIPLTGALAAGCLFITALRLEVGNALRNALALGLSIVNGYLVMNGMLNLFFNR